MRVKIKREALAKALKWELLLDKSITLKGKVKTNLFTRIFHHTPPEIEVEGEVVEDIEINVPSIGMLTEAGSGTVTGETVKPKPKLLAPALYSMSGINWH